MKERKIITTTTNHAEYLNLQLCWFLPSFLLAMSYTFRYMAELTLHLQVHGRADPTYTFRCMAGLILHLQVHGGLILHTPSSTWQG